MVASNCRKFFILSLILSCVISTFPVEGKENTSEAEIAKLIDDLESPIPLWQGDILHPYFQNQDPKDPYCHHRVTQAIQKLISHGTSIYPILVKHLDDPRFSYAAVYNGLKTHSVGWVIAWRIIPTEIEFFSRSSAYPSNMLIRLRETPTGKHGSPEWNIYFSKLNKKEWAKQAAKKSKLELRAEYIKWCMEYEKGHGFVSKEQELKVLVPYRDELARIEGLLEKKALKKPAP